MILYTCPHCGKDNKLKGIDPYLWVRCRKCELDMTCPPGTVLAASPHLDAADPAGDGADPSTGDVHPAGDARYAGDDVHSSSDAASPPQPRIGGLFADSPAGIARPADSPARAERSPAAAMVPGIEIFLEEPTLTEDNPMTQTDQHASQQTNQPAAAGSAASATGILPAESNAASAAGVPSVAGVPPARLAGILPAESNAASAAGISPAGPASPPLVARTYTGRSAQARPALLPIAIPRGSTLAGAAAGAFILAGLAAMVFGIMGNMLAALIGTIFVVGAVILLAIERLVLHLVQFRQEFAQHRQDLRDAARPDPDNRRPEDR